ncbi:MAG TPA: hypothetical protein VJB57_03575 [Dehalococcoidia bacterium]|nr:hypothetical protein [Dehalococcoidia bacterium]
MLSIDSFAAFNAAPTYALPIDRLARTFKRYLYISTAFATASLAFAIGVTVLALVYDLKTTPGRISTFAGFSSHVSTAAAGDPPALVQPAVSDLGPPGEPFASKPLPPADRVTINTTGAVSNVNITFYDCQEQGFCGAMYNGRKVYQGAAACSWDLSLGTRFVIEGDPTRRVYVCEDRGLLPDTWVDIFWNDPRDGLLWQSAVGRHGTVAIVEVP